MKSTVATKSYFLKKCSFWKVHLNSTGSGIWVWLKILLTKPTQNVNSYTSRAWLVSSTK